MRSLLFDYSHCGEGCGESRYGDAERRAADVVEVQRVAERDARRVSAVFAADSDLDSGAGLAALFGGYRHESAYAVAVKLREGVLLEDAHFDVLSEELAFRVVARVAEGGLREVVGSAAEELRVLGELVGDHRGARELYHGSDHVFELYAVLGELLLRDFVYEVAHGLHLELGSDERDHDVGDDLDALLRELARRVEDGAYLHLVDFRIDHAEAASAEAEHRVLLVEFAGAGDGRLYLLGLGAVRVEGLEGLRELRYLRKELVERRVEETDGDGQPFHGLEDSVEVGFLHDLEFVELYDSLFLRRGDYHLLHDGQTVGVHEHVLGAAEADALRSEGAGAAGVFRRVGVGPDLELRDLVGVVEELAEVVVELRVDEFHLADYDVAVASVEGEVFVFLDGHVADGEGFGGEVDLYGFGSGDAGLAESAGDEWSRDGRG